MMGKIALMEDYARKFGKHDLERLGLFIEMPYLRVKRKGTDKLKIAGVQRSMLAGGPKTKCGTMDGYFDNEFRRIFKGERPKPPKQLVGLPKLPFIPVGPSKKHSCPGDFFGTFGGHIPAFGRKEKPKGKYVHEKPNPVTRPGKQGGPGYIDITIGKYPEYKTNRVKFVKKPPPAGERKPPMITMHWPKPFFEVNPYRDPKRDPPTKRLYKRPNPEGPTKIFIPTGPGKLIDGCKAGGFSKWPIWRKDKYLSPAQIAKFGEDKTVATRGTFIPPSTGFKTLFTKSVLYKTDFCVNAQNWKTYEPTYVKYLL